MLSGYLMGAPMKYNIESIFGNRQSCLVILLGEILIPESYCKSSM